MNDIGQHHVFFAGKIAAILVSASVAAVSAIEDPDDDIAVTARTDEDGATVRPPRFTTAHAPDGAKESSFVGFDRAHRIDRHYIRSSRSFRFITRAARFDVELACRRAGEAFALHRLVVWLSPEAERIRAPESHTDRTGEDGETVGVQSLRLVVAADGAREADFETLHAFVTDRWVARFAVPTAQGLGGFHEIELSSLGRASHTFALDRLLLWISERADARPGDET